MLVSARALSSECLGRSSGTLCTRMLEATSPWPLPKRSSSSSLGLQQWSCPQVASRKKLSLLEIPWLNLGKEELFSWCVELAVKRVTIGL
uniref:Uncharacterized protein n=1 Tax=Rhizophora mucronata TaxID=61149 RepID=A0A2P2QQE2_RHIMU